MRGKRDEAWRRGHDRNISEALTDGRVRSRPARWPERWIWACLSMLLFLSVKASGDGQNLIVNGDFEMEDETSSKDVRKWLEWHDGDNTSGRIVVDAQRGHVLMREIRGKGIGGSIQSVKFALGDVINASVDVKTSAEFKDASALIKIEFKESNGDVMDFFESSFISEPTNGWKRINVKSPPVPSGVKDVCVSLFLLGGDSGGGKAYFDSVEVEILKEARK